MFKFAKFKSLRNVSIALLGVMLTLYFVVSFRKQMNTDMCNSIVPGSKLLINYMVRAKSRFDIFMYSIPLPGIAQLTAQRIIGMPGDTLQIKDKTVYINGIAITEPFDICYNFNFQTKRKLDSSYIALFQFIQGASIGPDHEYCYAIPKRYEQTLNADTAFVFFERKSDTPLRWDSECFPHDSIYPWNMDFYGPIRIPKRGDTLWSTSPWSNYYSNLRCQTCISLPSLLDAKKRRMYTLAQSDFYFFMGDNRDNANDSRRWGIIADEFIKGKVYLFN